MTPDQEQLLRLYRTQKTMKEACRIAGVEGWRHYKWLMDPEYRLVFKRINELKLDEYWRKKHGGDEMS